MNLDNIAAPEVQIGETRFFFSKMPAAKGFVVLEMIRAELGRRVTEDEEGITKVIGEAMDQLPTTRDSKNQETVDDPDLQALVDATNKRPDPEQLSGSALATFVTGVAKLVLGLDLSFVEKLRNVLFGTVRYQTIKSKTQRPLGNNEVDQDQAFENLEAIQVYEVMLRALAVNFFDSFRGLAGLLGLGDPRATNL